LQEFVAGSKSGFAWIRIILPDAIYSNALHYIMYNLKKEVIIAVFNVVVNGFKLGLVDHFICFRGNFWLSKKPDPILCKKVPIPKNFALLSLVDFLVIFKTNV
jgi:hypothetical protein